MDPAFEEIVAEQRQNVWGYWEGLKKKGFFSEKTIDVIDSKLYGCMNSINMEMVNLDSIEVDKKSKVSQLDIEIRNDDRVWISLLKQSLNTGNKQQSIQVSLSQTQKYLLNDWATADGKSLSGVAAEALAIGLAQLRKDKSIPEIVIKKYQMRCEMRTAFTEICEMIDMCYFGGEE